MHEELKRMYLKNNQVGFTGDEVEVIQAALDDYREKTLLAKPHPAGCICPKCPDLTIFPGTGILAKPRIGDADRDERLERLRIALGDGRITLEEFEARSTAVLAATMADELDYLVSDLPAVKKAQLPAKKKASTSRLTVAFIASLIMVVFPLMSVITITIGHKPVAAAVLAGLGALAGAIFVVTGDHFS